MPDITGDEGIDEVAYKLEDWDDEAFVEAEESLRRAGITFRREEHDTLIVNPADEAIVDRLLDEVENDRAGSAQGDNGQGIPMENDASHEELIYELVEWSPEMRNELSLVLEREEIAHEWEGDDLVVAAAVERQVDGLIDQMEQGEALPPAPVQQQAIQPFLSQPAPGGFQSLLIQFSHKRSPSHDEVPQQLLAVLGEHGFRMKLYPLDRQGAVAETHDLAFCRLR